MKTVTIIEENVGKIVKELVSVSCEMSAEELAKRIGISISTVKHSLVEVRDFCKKYDVNLINVPKKGYYIQASMEQKQLIKEELTLYMNSSEESDVYRRDYIIQSLFKYQGIYTLQLFSEELFVSRNLITKDIAYINDQFKKFDVQIAVRKNKGIFLEGQEKNIRQALIFYNNNKWWHNEIQEAPIEADPRISNKAWTFFRTVYLKEEPEILKMQRLLIDIEKVLTMRFTDVSFCQLIEYLTVAADRIQCNHTINSISTSISLEIENKYLQAAEIFLERYVKKKNASWKYECEFLAVKLYVSEVMHSRARKSGHRASIKMYLYEVLNSIDIGCKYDNEELIESIDDFLTIMIYSNNYHISDGTELKKDIKVKLAGLYAICLMKIDILQNSIGIVFQEDDLSRLVLLIHNYMKKERKTAVFVTASNEQVSYFQLNKLKENFPYIFFEKVIEYQDFCIDDYSDKIVIATVSLKEKANNVICITKHVNNDDIEKVKRHLELYRYEDQYLLENIFNEKRIYDLAVANKEEAILEISERMRQEGVVDMGFADEMLQREKNMITSIGNGIAIPHIYKTNVIESAVSVVRLKHSVKWSKDERVDLIFLFAIGDESPKAVKNLFVQIYHILTDEKNTEKIRKANDAKEIMRIILSCE